MGMYSVSRGILKLKPEWVVRFKEIMIGLDKEPYDHQFVQREYWQKFLNKSIHYSDWIFGYGSCDTDCFWDDGFDKLFKDAAGNSKFVDDYFFICFGSKAYDHLQFIEEIAPLICVDFFNIYIYEENYNEHDNYCFGGFQTAPDHHTEYFLSIHRSPKGLDVYEKFKDHFSKDVQNELYEFHNIGTGFNDD